MGLLGLSAHSFLFLALAAVYNVFCYFVPAMKYKILLKYAEERISVWNAFLTFTITKFSTTITPFVSGPMIAKPMASKYLANIPLKKGAFITAFEQLLDFGSFLLLIPMLMVFLGEQMFFNSIVPRLALFFAVIIFCAIALLKRKQLISFVWRVKAVLPKKIRAWGKNAGFSEESAHQLLDDMLAYVKNPRPIAALIPFFAFQFLAMPIILQLVAAAFDVGLSFKLAFVIYWFSSAVGKLSGVPGGFGVADVSLGGLLAANGVAAVTIIKIVSFYRVITLLPAIAIGAPLAFYIGAKYAKEKIIDKNGEEKNLSEMDRPSR